MDFPIGISIPDIHERELKANFPRSQWKREFPFTRGTECKQYEPPLMQSGNSQLLQFKFLWITKLEASRQLHNLINLTRAFLSFKLNQR